MKISTIKVNDKEIAIVKSNKLLITDLATKQIGCSSHLILNLYIMGGCICQKHEKC